MTTNPVIVTDNEIANRFELTVGGTLAGVLRYRRDGSVIDLVHTEVFDEFGGRGLGGLLVHRALAAVRAAGLQVAPSCWFVRDYVAAHPDEADLVARSGGEPPAQPKAEDSYDNTHC